jgi:hypothetical protein
VSDTPEIKGTDDDYLPVLAASRLGESDFAAHGAGEDTVLYSIAALSGEWNRIIRKLSDIFAISTTDAGGIRVEEISVQVTFNAKGKLVFVAEAGVTGAISIKLKPKT